MNEENNKVIALFMGGKFHKATEGHLEEDEIIFTERFCTDIVSMPQRAVSRLKFHTSWDWLMPVVDRIEQDGAVTIIKNGCTIETLNHEITVGGETTLIAVYAAVFAFIKWYNQHPHQ